MAPGTHRFLTTYGGLLRSIDGLTIDRFKPIVIVLAVALGALALAACGSDSAAPATAVPPAATSAPPAATSAPPASTAVPTVPTSAPPAATPVPPTAAPTSAPAPPATATPEPAPEPTATPELETVYSEYGFTPKLDLGADVQATGWTEPEPSDAQGLASFVYGGIALSLVWSPAGSGTPLAFLASSYNALRTVQPNLTFESISEGDITVSGQTGSFGGFKALDSGGAGKPRPPPDIMKGRPDPSGRPFFVFAAAKKKAKHVIANADCIEGCLASNFMAQSVLTGFPGESRE